VSLLSLMLIRKHMPPKNATIAAAVPAMES
jgi:hypothetical protein